jgi:hypothetical protein
VPADYKIDKARRLVTNTMTGVLTQDEVLTIVDRFMSDPDFDPNFSQLIDCRQVTKMKVNAEDVRQIADREIFSPDSRRAIVVTDAVTFGLGRMYEILRDLKGEKGIRVFRSIEEATDWIGAGGRPP